MACSYVLPTLDVAGALCAQVRLCICPTRTDASDRTVPVVISVRAPAMSSLHHSIHYCHYRHLL